ncbi:MAG: methylated-DNA--[protein]-cysteine S-methyltransferase [Solirubrobacteraceae bacterium]
MNETDDLERLLAGAGARLNPKPPDLPAAAAAAGMLDLAYTTTDSPLGPLLLASTDQGLVRVAYLDFADRDEVLQSLADRVSPRMLEAPGRLDEPRRELDDYFDGRRREFDLPLDRRLMSDFMRRVLSATATIPFGSVSTYGAVAREAGSSRGSRAAGNALGSNPMPIVIPCHRVLHADGGIGGYTGGLERKRMLLELERLPG